MKKKDWIIRNWLHKLPSNRWIQISRYQVSVGTGSFIRKELVFLHLSDLQSQWFGKNQRNLLKVVEGLCKKENPSFAVFTGDLIDRRFTDYQAGKSLIEGLGEKLKCYYVNGNHEVLLGKECESFVNEFKGRVYNLSGKVSLEEDGIILAGVDERWVYEARGFDRRGDAFDEAGLCKKINEMLGSVYKSEAVCKEKKAMIEGDLNGPVVLLSHEPQLISIYSSIPCQLVLSGHGHGGQVRLPLVGGLYAPEQGVLPKYTEGLHSFGGCKLIVNRGLGNSRFPLRIFNRPEIGVVHLTVYGETDTVKL